MYNSNKIVLIMRRDRTTTAPHSAHAFQSEVHTVVLNANYRSLTQVKNYSQTRAQSQRSFNLKNAWSNLTLDKANLME